MTLDGWRKPENPGGTHENMQIPHLKALAQNLTDTNFTVQREFWPFCTHSACQTHITLKIHPYNRFLLR